jgi:transglutaminase-like putative cysteine protease
MKVIVPMLRMLASDWYAKLSFLFSAILFWQWFDSLEGYWWPETFAVVHGILIASVIIEWVVPGPRWVRILLHAFAMIAVNAANNGFRIIAVPDEWKAWQAWGDWVSRLAGPFDPIIWISLPVLTAFLFAGYFCRTRLQVSLLTGASLLSLTILDSFTTIYFWDEVAWSVFVALSWLIAEHFERFQRKHPDTWSHLIEYPISFLLPVVLILSLVMVSGLIAPNIQPVLKDPYTLWMESRGESVPSFVGDKLESASLSSGSGDSRSGYSREDEELGGGFQFDYSEVMTVTTSRRSYWRGETKSVYTGTGWEDSEAELRESAVSAIGPEQTLPSLLDKMDVETEEITQGITMIREDPYPILFGAATVRSVVSINGEPSVPPSLAWLPASGELRWPRSGRTPYPLAYALISEVPVLDEAKLRAIEQPEDAAAMNAYLALPEGLPQRVKDLSAEITQEQATAYDKVRSIEAYLKNNYAYTNTPDLSKKKSEDFVDSFLFEIREGYCDYYSTAMAVLTRAAGIPTRWVKGYAPGVLPSEFFSGIPDEAFDPNMGGTYTVRNADAHSWVEVYFEGYGWIPFEATAGFAYPYSLPADAEPLTEIPLEDAAADTETAGARSDFGGIPLGWSIGGLVVLLAAAALLTRRMWAKMWKRLRFGTLTANQLIVLETEKLIRYCHKQGLTRSDNETLRESVSRWVNVRKSLQSDFSDVLLVFEKAKYSPFQANMEDVTNLSGKIKSIRDRL